MLNGHLANMKTLIMAAQTEDGKGFVSVPMESIDVKSVIGVLKKRDMWLILFGDTRLLALHGWFSARSIARRVTFFATAQKTSPKKRRHQCQLSSSVLTV